MNRWARMVVVATSAAGLASSGLLAGAGAAAPAATAQTMTIPVDRQDYVTAATTHNPTDGTTVDPYDADPSSIHVAVTSGSEFARSFVHLALDYLPSGALPSDATLTLHVTQQSDASNSGVYPIYNVNTAQAIVQACVLTTELPAKFDDSNPPKEDCAHGSTVGKPSHDGQTWTFGLKNLLAYWHAHGNTGAALVPVGSGESGQSWSVAYYRSRSSSQVTFTTVVPPVRHSNSGSNAGAPQSSVVPPASSSGPGGSTGTTGSPATSVVPPAPDAAVGASPAAVPPTVAGNAGAGQQPTSVPAAHHSNGGSSPVWPWVLVGSLAVAAGAIGWAHRAAVIAALPRVSTMWRTHPRAYTVAAVAASWGLVFTGYSAVTTPANHGTELAGDQQSVTPGAPTGATNAPAATTPAGTKAGTVTSGGAAATNPGVTGGQTTAGGAVAASSGNNPSVHAAQTEFQGNGSWRTINGVRVFFPADGGVPVAQLYSGADDVVGITSSQIELCAHAALTYGSAFHISASDLNVFWQYVADHGGVYGRSVHGDYTNDNYDPGTAVQAAQACKDKNTFLLLGGIGFDQIPAVRQWAEQNHVLYLHHIATIEGSQGLRYSFSDLPTVEQMGVQLGQIVARQFPHHKVAIIYRQSSNWTPALGPFKQYVQQSGSQIVGEYGVQINQGNYTQELTEARSAGAQVVLSWENALSEIEMLKQAENLNWHPAWLVNGFNIITNTLGRNALDQDMWSAGDWDAYDPGYYGGGFASYAAQIHEFEAEYKKYDSSADLSGDGGDLLFLNWEAQKWLYDLLLTCGKDCTRNKIAGLLLAGYHKVTPPNCPADFGRTTDHHHGGYLFNVLHAVRDPNGRANFVPVTRCVTSY